MSQTFTAKRRTPQQQGNDLLHERAENLFKLHLIDQASLLNHSILLIADKLFVEVSDKLHNSPALILTKMLIWNKKDNVNCFFFCSLEPLLQITQDTKPTTSSLDWSGHELSHKPFYVSSLHLM